MTRDVSMVDAGGFGIVAALLLLADRRTPLAWSRYGLWAVAAATPLAFKAWLGASSPDATASPTWAGDLFSSSRGLLSLTPVVYLALLGTLASLRANAASAATSLALFALWMVGNVIWATPSAGTPFDHGLTAALALLAPGLAHVIASARARPLMAVVPLVVFALAWNYWLMVQYTVGVLPKDQPVSFAAMVRQQSEVYTRSPYLYPFAFPANVWFAWREGVPADRYDLLALEPLQSAIDLRMDRHADRFLLEGWDAPGADAGGPVHWIGEPHATIALPLDLTDEHDISVLVVARTRLEAPAVHAQLGVEINGHEIGRALIPPGAPTDVRMAVPASAVGRVFRAGYNRIGFVSHGVRRVDPADRRPPGPLASRRDNHAWPVAIYRIRIAAAQ